MELLCSASSEERTQLLSAFLLEHSPHDFYPVRQSSIAKQVDNGASSTGLVIPRPEHDATQSRLRYRPRAHRAGFERHDQGAAIEMPVFAHPCRASHRDEFCVPRWVVVQFSDVRSRCDFLAGSIQQHCAHWHILRLAFRCEAREIHSAAHVRFVRGIDSHALVFLPSAR